MVQDERDVQQIIDVLRDTMINPFYVGADEMKLINIATGTVAPDDVTNGLLQAEVKGAEDMKNVVQQRLITSQVCNRYIHFLL